MAKAPTRDAGGKANRPHVLTWADKLAAELAVNVTIPPGSITAARYAAKAGVSRKYARDDLNKRWQRGELESRVILRERWYWPK